MTATSRPDGDLAEARGLAAFRRYEAIRDRLPAAPVMPAAPAHHDTLEAIADHYDAFVLDGFGVLNVGHTAIPGAVARMAGLRAAGKRLVVLTNAATLPPALARAKYRGMGFDFASDEIVSSRDIAVEAMAAFPAAARWGVSAAGPVSLEGLGPGAMALEDDDEPYDTADAFMLLSADAWDDTRQARLVAALAHRPRPVLVANPDLVAPREDGVSVEPGAWAHGLLDTVPGLDVRFFGKPFANAFAAVMARLGPAAPPRARIVMVGDTLHTDILGGAAAGFGTALVTRHGIYAGQQVAPLIAASGIVPHHVCAST
jgi:HAD superfamily hydrolase (TIGR01459 family)